MLAVLAAGRNRLVRVVHGLWADLPEAPLVTSCPLRQCLETVGVSAPSTVEEVGRSGADGDEALQFSQQGRQDSNLQPPVLETGALPIAPRPWAAVGV
jgi:hypothetical protein